MQTAAIVTVLGFEARALPQSPYLVVRRCRSAGAEIPATVRELAAAGSSVIISWGTAGALSPRLRAGDLCLPEQVYCDDVIPTNAQWRARVQRAIGEDRRVWSGSLLHSSDLVADPERKRALGESRGADAVDMESGLIGAACVEAGLAFLVIRSIVDELGDRLPYPIAARLGTDGSLRTGALVYDLLLRPRWWADVARLALRYRRARSGLSAAATALSSCVDDT